MTAHRHPLSYWAGVCPGNNVSAGKRKSAKTKGKSLAQGYFR